MTEFIVTIADKKDGAPCRLLELKGTMEQTFETLKALETAGIIADWKRNARRITGEPNDFDEVEA